MDNSSASFHLLCNDHHIYLDNSGNSRANTYKPEFRPEMEETLLLDQNQKLAGLLGC